MKEKINALQKEIKNYSGSGAEGIEAFRMKYISKKSVINDLFEDFKKLKAQQSQAKLSPNQPSPAAPPPPPSGGGSNVKVIRMPSSGGGDNPVDKDTGGSDVNAASTGNGNKAKWNILGIPMPF